MAIEFAHGSTSEVDALPIGRPVSTNPPEVSESTAEVAEPVAAPVLEDIDETQPTSENKQPLVHVILLPEHLLPRCSDVSRIEKSINGSCSRTLVKVVAHNIQDLCATRLSSIVPDNLGKEIFKTTEPVIVQKYVEHVAATCAPEIKYAYVILGVSMDCLSSDYVINSKYTTVIIPDDGLDDTNLSYNTRVRKNAEHIARKKEKECLRNHKLNKRERRQCRMRYCNANSVYCNSRDIVTAMADKLLAFANRATTNTGGGCQIEKVVLCTRERIRVLIQKIIGVDLDSD